MDAIVIGAGLAGLAAAARIAEAGRTVTVLEGRDRIGGRVWSEPNGDSAVELGPEWLGTAGPMAHLLRSAGAEVTPSEGDYFHRTARGWEPSRQLPAVRRLVRRLQNVAEPDLSLTEALRRERTGEDVNEAQQYLIPYVEGFHAADPDLLSVQWLGEAEQNQSAGDSDARAPSGLSQGVDALASRLDERATVRLESTVRSVSWEPGKVEISLDGHTTPIRARCAIVTVPLGVLKSRALRFDPELAEKQKAIDLLEMGHVKKVVLNFRRPFWLQAGAPDALFLQDFRQSVPTWWMPADEASAALVGWVGGPPAVRLGGSSPDAVVDLAVGSLAGMLGLTRAAVEQEMDQTWFHDWSGDAFSLGAYSYIRSGGIEAPERLGRPVEGTLFFAGEATCEHGYNATMDGAIQSGYRAADEALAQVRDWPD